MSLHKEISFELVICEHLAEDGWLYADKATAESHGNLAMLFTAVTGKIDVREFANVEAA
jgi:hypothetical protein